MKDESAAGPESNPLFLSSVAKSFEVLEALNAAGRPVGLTELAALSGIGRSAVQRITHTLCKLGYLRQDPLSRAYSLSGRMLEFGFTVLATDRLRARAQPHLQALNRQTGETVNLTKMEGDEIVYISRFPSIHAVSVDLHIGSRLPAFCTAAGRAMLSRMTEAEAMELLRRSRRDAMTATTTTDLDGLRRCLEEARRLGYALNDQEAFIGDISVAAPLLDYRGAPIGAVNVAVPFPRWQVPDVVARLVPALLRAASNINQL